MLLDLPDMKDRLNGIIYELEDSAFKALDSVVIADNLEQAFKDIDLGIFLGGQPRKPGTQPSL